MDERLTAAILGVIFAGSILNQFHWPLWTRLVARWDYFTFLPFWAFFAPNPGYAATHLVFRDRDADGWTEWTEIQIPDTTGWRWIWNPGRFERKAIQDLFNGLVRASKEVASPAALELTICYLALLSWVQAQPRLRAGATHRQFTVLQAIGHGPSRSLQAVVLSREYLLD
jgi:hypothetical protein